MKKKKRRKRKERGKARLDQGSSDGVWSGQVSRKRGNLTRMGSIPGRGWSRAALAALRITDGIGAQALGWRSETSVPGRGSARIGCCSGGCLHRLCVSIRAGKKKDGDWGQSEAVVEESTELAKKQEGGHACAGPG